MDIKLTQRSKLVFTILIITRIIAGSIYAYSRADLNRDGIVNLMDFSQVSEDWLSEDDTSIVVMIAAANASSREKLLADYICDGIDDQVEIQAAIDTLPSDASASNIGTIHLSEGDFFFTEPVICGTTDKRVNLTIVGSTGIDGTTIFLDKSISATIPLFTVGAYPVDLTIDDCVVSMVNFYNLKLNGNRAEVAEQKWAIVSIDAINDILSISDNHLDYLIPMQIIRVIGTSNNDRYYAIEEVNFDGTNTNIKVTRNVLEDSPGGFVKADKPCLDLVACKDSIFDHIYIRNTAGPGVQIRRSWTLTFRDCPIEGNVGAGVLIYSNKQPYNKYLNKFLKFRGNTFYQDSDGTNAFDELGGNYSISDSIFEIISEGGSGASISNIFITENYGNFTQNAVHLEGPVNQIYLSHNQFAPLEIPANGRYYTFKIDDARDNGNGPRDVIIENNFCDMGSSYSTPGPSLNAVIGVVKDDQGSNTEGIYARGNILYSNNGHECQLYHCDAITLNKQGRVRPLSDHNTVVLLSGKGLVHGAQAWGDWIFSNTGARETVNWGLPRAKTGMHLVFVRDSDQSINLSPLSGDKLDMQENTKSYSTGTIVELRCYVDSKWITLVQK
jgi:hypothetical protein